MLWHTIKTMDGRTLSNTHSIPMGHKWGWVVDTVAADAECDQDDVNIVEAEDGDIITVKGKHYARVTTEQTP